MQPHRSALAAALATSGDLTAAPEARLAACEVLIRMGVVDRTLPALRALTSIPKCAGRARLLLRTGEYFLRRGLLKDFAPVGGSRPTRDQDAVPDAAATAFWRHPDAAISSKNLLIVFTGIRKHFWISLDVLHRILRNHFGQILYLRDFDEVFFLAGVYGLGRGYPATLTRLKQFVRSSATNKIFVLGTSAGGFAALKYGLDLAATAILAFSAPTDLRADVPAPIRQRIAELQLRPDDLDVLPRYETAQQRPRVTMVYGSENIYDVSAAERFSHLPEFRLVAIPDVSKHDITAHLLGTGQFEQFLEELAYG